MIVTGTTGRIGSIECDRVSICNGQALLWREDDEKEGVYYTFMKIPVEQIAWILNHSSFKED